MYNGYLIKINSKILDLKYIKEFKSTPNRISDLDSYQDASGFLHRNTVEHTRSTIVLTTPPLYLADKIVIQNMIPNRVKLQVEYWNDEKNLYSTGSFYIPDIEFSVMVAYKDTLLYEPITLEFIEY